MWPALIFAARRNDKVIGRTVILEVSINTRNGLSHIGAPSGRRWAIVILGDFLVLDKISISHIGIPIDIVNRRCLDTLNV